MDGEMKKILLGILLNCWLATLAFALNGGVQLIGHYDNIVTFDSADPHQQGYGVDLYRNADGSVFGTFVFAPGTTEGVSAVLYDITWRQTTKSLKFKAKLSAGHESSKNYDRDSHDFFAFEGTLSDRFIVGRLTHKSGYEPQLPGTTINVKLKRDRSRLNGAYVPTSFDQWKKTSPPLANW